MRKIFLYTLIVYIFAVSAVSAQTGDAPKNVIYINSYNTKYGWSIILTESIINTLSEKNINLKTYYLDSHNTADTELEKKALEISNIINREKPDAVIISDDAAAKYVAQPYLLKSGIPIVFAGINWSASGYGLTPENSTGMVEINATGELFDIMNKIVGVSGKDVRVSILTVDNLTQKKNYDIETRLFNISFKKKFFVKNMDEWENAYTELQNGNDYIYMPNIGGIADWDENRALKVISEKTKIPSCATLDTMSRLVFMTFAKYPEEQGEFAANAVIKILYEGKNTSDIPVSSNKRARIILNKNFIENLGITVPGDILELSRIVP